MNISIELNSAQRKAVTAPVDTTLLVVAGAGSGKTRVITYRVAWLMDNGISPSSILLLTFTNKAAWEMLERVKALTNVNLKNFWGGTFHSVANRILRREGWRLGYDASFTILDRSDSVELIRLVRKERLKKSEIVQFPSAKILAECFSFAANTGLSVIEAADMKIRGFEGPYELLEEIRNGYEKMKRDSNGMDFDDLLLNLSAVLDKDTVWRNRFSHLLVDEFQDTNSLQFELLEKLAGPDCHPCVVGDDAQSIYSFRGADPGNILRFSGKWPGAELIKLETNYRSTPEILDLANDSIKNNIGGIEKKLRAVSPSGVRPLVVRKAGQRAQASFVVDTVNGLIYNGESPSQIAVLYRSHYASLEIQFEMQRKSIPFIVRSGLKYFETAHVKDVVAFLKTGVNPKDRSSWLRILTMLPGVGPVSAARAIGVMDNVAQNPKGAEVRGNVEKVLPGQSRDEWNALFDNLVDVRRICKEDRPGDAVAKVLEGPYARYMMNRYDNYDSRLDDLIRLGEFAGSFKSTDEFLSELSLVDGVSGDAPRNAERTEEDCVILSTVHQAKGLEWNVVILVGMAEGIFPSSRVDTEEEFEEERRLFYVAVTRAGKRLIIVFPGMNEAGRRGRYMFEPSTFLAELDPDLYDFVDDFYGGNYDW